MRAHRGETLDPPRRVEILRVEDQRPSSYFKVGQFGYARVRHTSGGFATQDAGESKPGQTVYAVSKAKDGRGGAVWFTEDGIRFTGQIARGSIPRHETSGRFESQPKKSHAQIKREVDEILSSGKSHRSSMRKGSGSVAAPHSFVAKIWSTSKRPLLGGVMRTESTPFSHRGDAESFLAQSIETNANAGRDVAGTIALSRKPAAIMRHAATGELVTERDWGSPAWKQRMRKAGWKV